MLCKKLCVTCVMSGCREWCQGIFPFLPTPCLPPTNLALPTIHSQANGRQTTVYEVGALFIYLFIYYTFMQCFNSIFVITTVIFYYYLFKFETYKLYCYLYFKHENYKALLMITMLQILFCFVLFCLHDKDKIVLLWICL